MDKFFKSYSKAMSSPASVSSDNQPVSNKIYTYNESDEPIKPCIIIEENNKFQFMFSSVSSYIGKGTYSIDGKTAVLNTDDGNYHYSFTIKDDSLVFDANNSSDNTWFSNLKDGAIFR